MNTNKFAEVSERSARISDLIEEIAQLDELIELHHAHNAHTLELQQYLDRRDGFITELNTLLHPLHMKVVLEEHPV